MNDRFPVAKQQRSPLESENVSDERHIAEYLITLTVS